MSYLYLNLYSMPETLYLTRSGFPEIIAIQQLIKKFQVRNINFFELPLDYLSHFDTSNTEVLTKKLFESGGKYHFVLERFNPQTIEFYIDQCLRNGQTSTRIKLPHSAPAFYGGNRYLAPHFDDDFRAFVRDLEIVVPILEMNGFRVCVENHQDLASEDLSQLITQFGPSVGVTWDVGNTFATCELFSRFFSRLNSSISHIHLKDYKIRKSGFGLELVRTVNGSGAVDWKEFKSEFLTQLPDDTVLSVELGAMIPREVHHQHPDYFSCFERDEMEKRDWFEFLATCDIEFMTFEDNTVDYYVAGDSSLGFSINEFEEACAAFGFMKGELGE